MAVARIVDMKAARSLAEGVEGASAPRDHLASRRPLFSFGPQTGVSTSQLESQSTRGGGRRRELAPGPAGFAL